MANLASGGGRIHHGRCIRLPGIWTYKADPSIKAMVVRYSSLRNILCRNLATSITVGRNGLCFNSDVETPELVLA